MKNLFLLIFGLFLFGCSTTPIPTGDRITSVSWVNQTPYAYRLIETSFCNDTTSVTLEGLPAYSEKAMAVDLSPTKGCRINVTPVIGTNPLNSQSSWIPDPRQITLDNTYHLRIILFPNLPPRLNLEPVTIAQRRLSEAGRKIREN